MEKELNEIINYDESLRENVFDKYLMILRKIAQYDNKLTSIIDRIIEFNQKYFNELP